MCKSPEVGKRLANPGMSKLPVCCNRVKEVTRGRGPGGGVAGDRWDKILQASVKTRWGCS